MSAPILRDYQEACVAAHWSYFTGSPEGHPLFVVPTGGGKSHIIAAFLQRSIIAFPDTRAMIVTHVKELIEQNYEKLCQHWDGVAPAGIYSAGMNSRDTEDAIVLAGIQSVYKRPEAFGRRDLILIDESHLTPKSGNGMYLQFLAGMRAINPDVRILGYTATPYRLSGGPLIEGEDRIFTDIAYEVDVRMLVERGFLSPIIAKQPEHEIDLSNVHVKAGEYVEGEVQKAAMQQVAEHVDEIVALGKRTERKSWLLFASGVEHAVGITVKLRARGVDARCVFGYTPKEEREALVRDFRAGRFTALVNVGVLTTGFDAPAIDLIAILRATKSPGLYVQMAGRGMRLAPGKVDCLLLDYGGNVRRHGPLNHVIPPPLPGEPSEAPEGERAWLCKECSTLNALDDAKCVSCGAPKPVAERVDPDEKLDRTASTDQVIYVKPEWLEVDSVFYKRHSKPGGRPTMRVDYFCGMRVFSEWICFEHEGFPQRKAHQWWRRRSKWIRENPPTHPDFARGEPPKTVDEAVKRAKFGSAGPELAEPLEIMVEPEGKFWKIKDYRFNLK